MSKFIRVLAALTFIACKQDSPDEGGVSPVPPPAGLSYASNPAQYTVGVTIPPNTPTSSGGAVTSYAVAPALPAGLGLDATTGVISGTPTAATPIATYTVTASNAAGSTTADLSIVVNPALQPPANLYYPSNPALYTVGVAIAPNAPTIMGGAVNSYSVTPALPAGLGLDPTTGVITGTPTLATPVAIYTVTASNAAGSTAIALSIVVARESSALVDVDIRVASPGDPWLGRGGNTAWVTVVSTYSISSVVGDVVSHVSKSRETFPFAPDPHGSCDASIGASCWLASPALDAFPRGAASLVVTATDVLGNSNQAAYFLNVDRSPTLTIASPAEGALAHPTILVSASCADDDPAGCASLSVQSGSGLVFVEGTSVVDATIDLARLDGQPAKLYFTARDSAGNQVGAARTVYVEASSSLTPWPMLPGPVWDVLGSRVLFRAESAVPPAVKIRDVSAGVEETVESGDDLSCSNHTGRLTPVGALWVRADYCTDLPGMAPRTCSLYEWAAGFDTRLALLDSCMSLGVAGAHAVYNEAVGQDGWTLKLRDGVTRTSIDVLAGSIACRTGNDVTSSGDVAYCRMDDRNVYRWAGGTAIQVTHDSPSVTVNGGPITDGTSVVYTKSSANLGANDWRIAVHDGGVETILASVPGREPQVPVDYAVASGWVAYTRPDATGVKQVWRHSASGESQVTVFGAPCSIDAIGPDGTIVLSTGTGRYRAAVGSQPVRIGTTLGRVVHRDGKFYVLIGPNVLEVNP